MTTSPEIKKFVLPLDGVWEFREFPESARRMRDLEGGSWKPAVVPSSIYTCLNESGLIDVFELRADPADFNWVSETSWVFKKSFDWPSEHCRKDHVQLVFEGLDTVTQIWLNEKLIAKTDNMFIPHTVDVTSIIKPGCNTLMVKFLPAKAESQRRMLRYGKLSEHHFGDPCRTYLRKAQYQFGSVLGPSLPGCGIFRSVRLEAIETASIKDIYIRTIDCSQHSADIRIELSITHPGKCQNRLRCRLTVSGGGLDMQHELPVDTKDNRLTTVIRIERPILWWPKGYGVQHLYHLNVQLLTEAGKCLDEAARDFGVRMIRLNRSADKLGHSFCIEVNEQPIAIRGANWMPLSILTASQSPEAYKTLLSKCANSHINMLRVWAGGYYEDPFFYQVCDRLGILVWQDFMFVSAYYPDRQWFKETVETEARSIICRLRSHACLALWCGNSRIDQLHKEGRLGSGRKFYGKSIYHNILPELLNELDPDHDYIPTTPFFEPAEKDPKADTGGTTHSWQMWTHYASVTEQMQQNPKAPRFVVEFGMQSLPELETLKTFCRPRDLQLSSPGLEKHAYQPGSISRLASYAADTFPPPRCIEEEIWQSQVIQARSLKMYVEFLRANRGANAGALFWSLNDAAPSIGFSAFDYLLRPKAAAFYMRRFFAPILVTLVEESANQQFKAVIINDSPKRITATLCCTLLDFNGRQLDESRIPVTVSPFSVSTPGILPKLFRSPPAPYQTFLNLHLFSDENTLAENQHFFCPDKHAMWPAAKFDLTITPTEEKNNWLIQLHSTCVIRDLQIIPPRPADCSNNFLTLRPGYTETVEIRYLKNAPSLQTPIQFLCSNHVCGY